MSPSYTNDSEVRVIGIVFGEHVELQYVETTDIRDSGQVTQQRVFTVDPSHPTYQQEIKLLREMAEDLVKDLMEDWPNKKPVDLNPPEDDDVDRGMGDGLG